MRGTLGGRGAGLVERRVQPEQVGREDSHGRVDDRRRIAGIRRLPAVVGSRRGDLRRVLNAVPRSGEIRGRPDVVAECLLVADARGETP